MTRTDVRNAVLIGLAVLAICLATLWVVLVVGARLAMGAA